MITWHVRKDPPHTNKQGIRDVRSWERHQTWVQTVNAAKVCFIPLAYKNGMYIYRVTPCSSSNTKHYP